MNKIDIDINSVNPSRQTIIILTIGDNAILLTKWIIMANKIDMNIVGDKLLNCFKILYSIALPQ